MPQAPLCSASSLASSLKTRCLRVALMMMVAAALFGFAPAAAQAQTAHPGGVKSFTGFSSPYGIGFDGAGNFYYASFGSKVYKGVLANGVFTGAALAPTFGNAVGLAVDTAGNFFVTDAFQNIVYKETLQGDGSYVATTLATSATIGSTSVFGVALDGSGNVLILTTQALYKLTYNGSTYSAPVKISTTAFLNGVTVTVSAAGAIYAADSSGKAIYRYIGSGTTYAETKLAITGLGHPSSASADPAGNIYVVDGGLGKIILETPVGATYTATTVATAGEGASLLTSSGILYASDNNSQVVRGIGSLPNSFAATPVGTAATAMPVPFTIDTAGTLPALSNANVLTQGTPGLDFTLGSGSTCTGAVTAGQTCTVNVAFTPQFPGQRLGAVNLYDSTGTNVIATALISGTGTGALATLSPGLISTVAGNGVNCMGGTSCGDGGSATAASFSNPTDIAVDAAGNLYIADENDGRVRKVTAATGIVSTLAGGGTAPSTCTGSTNTVGDGCLATAATLSSPFGVAVDGAGNVYVPDQGGNRVRKVAAATGIISTIAGTGTSGYTASQDTGTTLGSATMISTPNGVAVDAAGTCISTIWGTTVFAWWRRPPASSARWPVAAPRQPPAPVPRTRLEMAVWPRQRPS